MLYPDFRKSFYFFNVFSSTFLFFLFGALFLSCSVGLNKSKLQPPNRLSIDSIQVKRFVSNLELRLPNYLEASTSKKQPTSIQNENSNSSLNNEPNNSPFGPTTNISINLKKSDSLSFTLYTIDGRDSCILYSGFTPRGQNILKLPVDDLQMGLYLYVVRYSCGSRIVKKILLIR